MLSVYTFFTDSFIYILNGLIELMYVKYCKKDKINDHDIWVFYQRFLVFRNCEFNSKRTKYRHQYVLCIYIHLLSEYMFIFTSYI